MTELNFWTQLREQRLRRRSALGGLAVAGGTGLTSLTLAACSSAPRRTQQGNTGQGIQSANSKPRLGGTFHTSTAINPNSIDPQKPKGDGAHLVTGSVMSRPFRLKTGADPKVALSQTLENDLALSAESPDAVTWTLKLRRDAKFQNIAPVNGHAVEAEDFRASFQRALTLPGSLVASFFTMIDKDQIEAPAADTVVFKLKYPYGPFPDSLSVNSSICPREALAGAYDPSKQAIGSGPFILTDYTPDVSISLKKNPDWFESASGGPYVDEVEIAIIPTEAQQLAQFSTGKLEEFWPDIGNVDATKRQNPTAIAASVPNIQAYQIYGHMDSPSSPWQDIRVRQAVSLAIDRDTIGKVIFNGQYRTNGVMSSVGRGALPPEQLGAASQYFRYDPAQAKRLVAEAGAADMFSALLYPTGNYGALYDKLAQMINPMLNAVGFKTQLVALDYNRQWVGVDTGAFYGHYPNNNLLLTVWVDAAQSADVTLIPALLPDGASNHPRVNDPQLTQKVTQMQALPDEKQRMSQAEAIQRYVAEKLYYVSGIPTGDKYYFTQPWVQNYAYCRQGPEGSEGTETYAKLWLTQ